MENYNKDDYRYRTAKKKVKDIKGFYTHLVVYLFVNIAILVVSTRDEGLWEGLTEWTNYLTAFFWGIGIIAHWASVFGPNIFLGKDWEERKIRELMEKEQQRKWE